MGEAPVSGLKLGVCGGVGVITGAGGAERDGMTSRRP